MTPVQITQLRQLLKEIHDSILPRIHTRYSGNFKEFSTELVAARWACSEKVRQALALLPCPTCNGSEIKKPDSGCGVCLAGDGNCRAECPCPDCK